MNYDELISRQIIWPDRDAQPGRKTALMFTNCTGRALCDYLKRNEEFRASYNINALESGPIQLAIGEGKNVFGLGAVQRLFQDCDFLLTNNMGARHADMALEKIKPMLSGSAKIITFVATNFSCLWPLSYGYSGMLGAERLFDAGATVEDVWKKLKDGTFDPEFKLRWRLEIGRLMDKSTFHDVDIHHFIIANIRRVKLFTSASHPTYHIVAHIGGRILDLLGIQHEGLEANLKHDCMDGTMAGWPDSQYEWRHYGFEYPRSNKDEPHEWYLEMLHEACAWWQRGAFMPPPKD